MLVNVATSYVSSLRFLKQNLLNRLQTCLSCFRQVNEIAIVLTVQCSTLRSGSDSIATPIHELNYPPLELRDSTSIIIIPGHSKRNHFCFLAAKLGVVILHLPKIPCPRRAPVKAFINSGRGIRIVSLYCPACSWVVLNGPDSPDVSIQMMKVDYLTLKQTAAKLLSIALGPSNRDQQQN